MDRLAGLRVIHACWDQKEIDFLSNRHSGPLLTDELLFQASVFGTKEHRALETLMKGKKLPSPREPLTTIKKALLEL